MPIKACTLPIVGLPYHEAPKIWPEISGDASPRLLKPRLMSSYLGLRLVPEDNPKDPNAVRVDIASHEMANGLPVKIGYVLKQKAVAIRDLLDKAQILGVGLPDLSEVDRPEPRTVWFAQIHSDILPDGFKELYTMDKPWLPLQIWPAQASPKRPAFAARPADIWF